MPAAPGTSPERIKDANTRYHDAAAAEYDGKWGIDFGEIGRAQVTAKVAKALGREPRPFGDALEIGAGTGYFGLNLMAAGLVERLTATDISSGMLDSLETTAKRLGLKVKTERTEAEDLPFRRESFDLVFGHAILHHIPDLETGLRRVSPRPAPRRHRRLLRRALALRRPARGAAQARRPRRGATLAPPRRRRRAPSRPGAELRRPRVRGRGRCPRLRPRRSANPPRRRRLRDVRIRGEELLANMHGWTLRTVESTAEPDQIPMGWRRFAFRSYIALQKVDTRLLEPRLPAELFYNLLLSARK